MAWSQHWLRSWKFNGYTKHKANTPDCVAVINICLKNIWGVDLIFYYTLQSPTYPKSIGIIFRCLSLWKCDILCFTCLNGDRAFLSIFCWLLEWSRDCISILFTGSSLLLLNIAVSHALVSSCFNIFEREQFLMNLQLRTSNFFLCSFFHTLSATFVFSSFPL